jgi:RNA polymerase sigma-70 factor (ECF subfamily)
MGKDAVSSFTTSRFPVLRLSQVKLGGAEAVSTDRSQSFESTDEALIERIQTGDRDALALLFRRYAHPVRNVGRRILRDKAEADDLVQEVFLYIHRKSALFDRTKGSAGSWIIQVAYTQALLRRRRLQSQGFYLSGITDKVVECRNDSTEGADYDQSVEGLFGRNGWRKVLESLTEDQRETLRLHFFEGHTFEEIAEKLGQSYGNVRNHHYRGLEKLRKHLADVGLNRR